MSSSVNTAKSMSANLKKNQSTSDCGCNSKTKFKKISKLLKKRKK